VLIIGFEPRFAPRCRPFSIQGVARRNLLLRFFAALAFLVIAASVRADPAVTVARGVAFVINEDPSNPLGQRQAGSVLWRINRIKAIGQSDELVIHAEIGIPEMNMTVTIDLKRNTDKSLPASHLVELKYVLPQDVAGGSVISVPGIMMKFAESVRGTPLNAQSVKIVDGSFLIALSNQEVDRARNLQLLKERAWFDIPMIYANQHRGILSIEKSFRGEDVFHEAMTAWERPR
jgi:hypothetical protein